MDDVNIVGLDLSLTATGVATDEETDTLKTGTTGMERLVTLNTFISAYTQDADLVVIEGYSFGTQRQASHAHALGELGGVVRLSLWRSSIPYVDVSPASLKKYATGKGNANKLEVLVAAVKRLDYDGSSDNEADALWLRQMGLAHCQPSHAVTMPALNRSALDGVEWPDGITVLERAAAFVAET